MVTDRCISGTGLEGPPRSAPSALWGGSRAPPGRGARPLETTVKVELWAECWV